MTVSRLQAGVAQIDITGPIGLPLASEANLRVSKGVRSPLLAKALVLSDGEETLAVVTLDLYGLQSEAAEALASRVAERSGLKPEAVMVVSSHTRAAPYTTPVVGRDGVDDDYIAEVIDKADGAVAEALANLQDASLGVGRAILPHLVYNHRLMTRNMKAVTAWVGVPQNEVLAPEGPTDPEFSVFVVRDAHGFPLCFLWSLAADNRFSQDDLISADLPGLVQQELARRLGRQVPSLYLSGCGGNVSYVHELEKSADAVASAIMAAQLETPCDPMVQLGCTRERMILPIRPYDRFWSRADIELKWPSAMEAYAREVELMQQKGEHAVPTSVQVFRLGQWALVGLPGMPFVEFALQIKDKSPFLATVVAGNVGGHVGYVVTRRAFEGEGLEAWPARSAMVGPGGGEFMAEEVASLLWQLWPYRAAARSTRNEP